MDEYVTNQMVSDEEDINAWIELMQELKRRSNKIEDRRQKKIEKAQKACHYAPYPCAPPALTVTSNSVAQIGRVVTKPRRPGICFKCGMANNLKFECPNTVNRKIGIAIELAWFIYIHVLFYRHPYNAECTKQFAEDGNS